MSSISDRCSDDSRTLPAINKGWLYLEVGKGGGVDGGGEGRGGEGSGREGREGREGRGGEGRGGEGREGGGIYCIQLVAHHICF